MWETNYLNNADHGINSTTYCYKAGVSGVDLITEIPGVSVNPPFDKVPVPSKESLPAETQESLEQVEGLSDTINVFIAKADEIYSEDSEEGNPRTNNSNTLEYGSQPMTYSVP